MKEVEDDSEARSRAIEDAFVTHWSNFGRWSQGSLTDRDGILWFETPIPFLPYNMVIRTQIPDAIDADEAISRVAGRFRDRGVPYLWVQRPSDSPADLGSRLARHGLDLVETATGMDLDLDEWELESIGDDSDIHVVDYDPQRLLDYVELIRTYWSVPESEQHMLVRLNQDLAGDAAPGFRLVAYVDGEPAGKLFANLAELPDRVAIYGVAVRPEARGRGIATRLMNRAISSARDRGARRCVLHSSTMALSMYRRMGFVERCQLQAYATGPLFGTHHH